MFSKALAFTTLAVCAIRYITFYGFSTNANLLEQSKIRDPIEHEYFKNLSTLWESVEDECQDFELTGNTDWQMPEWAEGVFVTSGPSKHEMNTTKFGHLLDGFGRFSNIKFREGKAHFTSKMIKSGFFNRS